MVEAHPVMRDVAGANCRGCAVAGSPAVTVVACATARSTSSRVTRPPLPVPGDPRRVDAVLLARAADGGAEAGFRTRSPERARAASRSSVKARFDCPARLARANGFTCGSINPPQQRPRHRLRIRIEHDLRKHACRRGRHFLRHLVGLELDQRIVLGNRVADRLEPRAHHRLGAFLLVGNADFDQVSEPHQPVDLGADARRRSAAPIPSAWDDAGLGCRAW